MYVCECVKRIKVANLGLLLRMVAWLLASSAKKGASWFRSSPGYLLRVYGREVSAGVCACRTLCLCVCVG